MEIRVRNAGAEDVPLLKQLIDEMSEFERLPHYITEDALLRDGFGAIPKFRALVASADEEAAGYAFVHGCYSSFEGAGLYLEDLYVRPGFRGQSVGKVLLAAVARLAMEQDCFGIVLNVLHWNSPAFAFFERAGANELNDRRVLCIKRECFGELARS
jgi:GNAT superfamily N-acetyltransferase